MEGTARPESQGELRDSGPGCGARGRRQGLAEQRADAPSQPAPHQAPPVRRAPQDRRARASYATRGQAAVPADGGGAWPNNEPTHQANQHHTKPHRRGGRRRIQRARTGFEARRCRATPLRLADDRAGTRITSGTSSNIHTRATPAHAHEHHSSTTKPPPDTPHSGTTTQPTGTHTTRARQSRPAPTVAGRQWR